MVKLYSLQLKGVRVIRADYINRQPAGCNTRYFAVYPASALQDELMSVRDTLGELPGVMMAAYAPATFEDISVKVVFVELTPGTDATPILAKMKQLANPVMPYTIETFVLQLLVCKCNYVSSAPSITFAPGLGPDDREAFNLRLAAGAQKLPVELFDKAAAGDIEPLRRAFYDVLNSVGAHVSSSEILPFQPDPRPCTHPQ